MDQMETLHWPLSVLSRAVHFKNLTGASAHVGLSQPQLSRIVSQLEKEFNVTLLDRTARRKSGWTNTAFRLAEIYGQNSRKLQDALNEALAAQVPSQVRIGTLEGLSSIALNLAKSFLEDSKVHSVELDVFDQNELEQKFLNGDIDLMLSSRTPGKQKFKHVLELGQQTFKTFNDTDKVSVRSPYEHGSQKRKPEDRDRKLFISNSLALRKTWLETFGGVGDLPSKVKRGRGAEHVVLLIGHELFHENLWDFVEKQAEKVIHTTID